MIEVSKDYTGKWINKDAPFNIYESSEEFLNNYNGEHPGTYVWQQIFNIDYIIDDLTTHENPSTYHQGVGLDELLPASKVGYQFIGWVDENGDSVESISKTSDVNLMLEAVFIANDYDIEYDLDGGINHPDNPLTYTYGVGVESFFNPTKEGYVFKGWVNSEGEEFLAISETQMEKQILKAIWEKLDDDKKPIDKEEPEENIKPDESKEQTTPKTGLKNNRLLYVLIVFSSLLILTKNKRKNRI